MGQAMDRLYIMATLYTVEKSARKMPLGSAWTPYQESSDSITLPNNTFLGRVKSLKLGTKRV